MIIVIAIVIVVVVIVIVIVMFIIKIVVVMLVLMLTNANNTSSVTSPVFVSGSRWRRTASWSSPGGGAVSCGPCACRTH